MASSSDAFLSLSSSSAIKICPREEELLSTYSYTCSEQSCVGQQFVSSSNLSMHMKKHHNKSEPSLDPNTRREFYCPQVHCCYNVESTPALFFSSKKYLRQHWQKVHAEKKFDCAKCPKKFATSSLKDNHERNCGVFECPQCLWQFKAKETLTSHMRRKGHTFPEEGKECVVGPKRKRQKTKAPKKKELMQSHKTSSVNVGTQTQLKSDMLKRQQTPSQHTEGSAEKAASHDFIDNQSQTMLNGDLIALSDDSFSCFNNVDRVNHTETQTDVFDGILENTPGSGGNTMDNLDAIIYSNDMYTQTCNNIIKELLMNDIETQTMWNKTVDRESDFVSTETQTTFTQCLNLNSSIHTQTKASSSCLPLEGVGSTFNSTHTQT